MAQPAAFGLNVNPHAGGLAIAGRIAAIADSAGLEYVGIQDHPYNADFLDTFTVITWLAARTSRVHLFPNVANLPLRPPAMLAKQAASIDVLSGGRFELGLGAGAFADGIAGMGGPRRTPGEARAALSEAIDVIRASWAGEPFSFDGSYYQLPGVQPGPRPAHPVGLWLGVVGPRAAALVGAKADGWSVSAPYVPPERLPELNDIITGAALEANRDPGPDHPALQRHGADLRGGPGPVPRPGRALDRDAGQPVHGPADERVRVLAVRGPGTPVPHLRGGGRPGGPRGAAGPARAGLSPGARVRAG